MKKLLAIISIVIFAFASAMMIKADEVMTYEDFEYVLLDGEVTIKTYKGTGTTVAIPDEIEGSPVTQIDAYVFTHKKVIKSVSIPNTVKKISTSAFYGCKSLERVDITDIEAWCNLHFSNKSSNPLYNGADLYLGGELLTELELGETAKKIGRYAFYGCDTLEKATLPENMRHIGEYAFYGCENLKSINFPSGVKEIREYTFYGCSSLKDITIADDVTSFGKNAFDGCDRIACNEYNNALYYGTESNPYMILKKAVSKSITSVEVHPDTKVINNYAFYYCTSLESISMPDGITNIGAYAFYNCWKLDGGIELDEQVTYIGEYAFKYCSGLESIVIPEGTVTIGDEEFYGCSNLKSLTLPESLKTIGVDGFKNCYGLEQIYFNSVSLNATLKEVIVSNAWSGEYIEFEYVSPFMYAGRSSSGITVTVGNKVKRIPAHMFYPYELSAIRTNVTNVVFEEGSVCESIGYKAFAYCNLESIDLPSSVTAIGSYSMYATRLESVTIPDSVTSIGTKAFYRCAPFDIHYCGTVEQWAEVSIADDNADITAATMTYGHDWSDWTTVVEPKENEDGYKERKCSICHKTEQEAVAYVGDGAQE